MMKNQYFGDVRDLFKYDLATALIENSGALDQFMFIPMLTENDGREDGGKIGYDKAKAGTGNEELVSTLKGCVEQNRRYIGEIRQYFKDRGIKITIHNEGKYLVNKTRQQYFEAINDEDIDNSLVFLDPDNGMEIKKSSEKHALNKEIKVNRPGFTGDSVA